MGWLQGIVGEEISQILVGKNKLKWSVMKRVTEADNNACIAFFNKRAAVKCFLKKEHPESSTIN